MTTASTHGELSHLEPGIMDRVGDRVRQFICGLHGHDSLLHFERDRLSLMCTSCSYESPGWDMKRTAKQPEVAATTVAGLPLVGTHRIIA
jgi:hypothetical protein